MEEKKTIWDYIGQVFFNFGMIMVILILIYSISGDSAKGYSSMFSYGSEAIGLTTMFQYLMLSILFLGARILFFTDLVFKRLCRVGRLLGMLSVIIAIIVLFIFLFDWFPVGYWKPWLMFFICFGVSAIISIVVSIFKERSENRKMEEALRRLKEEMREQDDVCSRIK